MSLSMHMSAHMSTHTHLQLDKSDLAVRQHAGDGRTPFSILVWRPHTFTVLSRRAATSKPRKKQKKYAKVRPFAIKPSTKVGGLLASFYGVR